MRVRTLAISSLAVAIFAAVLLGLPATGDTLDSAVVNVSRPPSSAADCAPCHLEIDRTDVRGLTFSHVEHPPSECTACHLRPAHEADLTYRPVMRTCFSCHGMFHGPQEVLASGECETCHTAEHTFRPGSHVANWEEEPHAKAAEVTGVNECMMCHEALADCDTCHATQAPDVGPMPRIYLRYVPIEPERPPVHVDTAQPVSIGQCAYCHTTIAETRDERLIFPHDPHLERDFDCAACHEVFPHQADATVVPDMLSCYRCHSLVHSTQGEVATEQCSACHPPAFDLVPEDHTLEFVTGEHTQQAEENMKSCTMCHASAFCTECHIGGFEMADGTLSEPVVPEGHRLREWIPEHGDEFLGQRGACSICHTRVSCTECHLTAMPHPQGWLSLHAADDVRLVDDCNVCHTDRSSCQECHHAAVADVELLPVNCVDCHEEMKTEPATDIRNPRLAEHAVHFNVAERVGRPYVCDDCHVGFEARPGPAPAAPAQAHDLRLCYECHGNLGIDGILIAPYPGSELCRRCHDDLRL